MSVINQEVHSCDVGEAEHLLHQVYPIARFQESRDRFSFFQQVRGDDRAVLARFSISSWTDIQVDFEQTLGFGHVLSGAYRATSNGDEIDPRAPFLLRPGVGRSQSEGLDLLMVNLDERELRRYVGAVHGIENVRVRFPGVAPRSKAAATVWLQTVAYARGAFETPGHLTNDILRRSVVDMLFAAALTAFPLEVSGSQRPGGDEATLPSPVRRAVAGRPRSGRCSGSRFIGVAEPGGIQCSAAVARSATTGS